jgi:hypothetical protein
LINALPLHSFRVKLPVSAPWLCCSDFDLRLDLDEAPLLAGWSGE